MRPLNKEQARAILDAVKAGKKDACESRIRQALALTGDIVKGKPFIPRIREPKRGQAEIPRVGSIFWLGEQHKEAA